MDDTITQDTPTGSTAPAPAPEQQSAASAPAAAPAPQVATQIADAPAPPPPTAPAVAASDAAPATFGEAVEYAPSGDSNLDLAMAFAGKHGLGPEHPAIVAAGHGDFGPVKALLAEKGIQGWEAYAALAEQGYQNLVAQEAAKIQEVQQIVLQAAGGASQWAETLAWARANAEPHEQEAADAALAQGGLLAEAMAAFLVQQHRAATGTTYAPAATAVQPDAGRGAASNGAALSPREYANAVADLRRTLGSRMETSSEYRQLQAKRVAWRG